MLTLPLLDREEAVQLNLCLGGALMIVHHGVWPMSFIDEIRSDPAAWLARARAEPEEPLVAAPHPLPSIEDAERLEEAVSGKSPRFDRPIISAGPGTPGSAAPQSGAQVTGGRSGRFEGDGAQRGDRVGRSP